MHRILIVIDMQKDFIDGSLGTSEAVSIVPKVIEKIENFEGDLIFTFDTHGDDYLNTQEGKNLPVPHCIKGTEGWMLPARLEQLRQELKARSFEKPTFGSVKMTEYLVKLNETEPIESIEIIGLCTDICVISNALLIKANLVEVPISVDAACCAGVTPGKHAAALETMRSCQIAVNNA